MLGKGFTQALVHHIKLQCLKQTLLKKVVANGIDLTTFLHPNYVLLGDSYGILVGVFFLQLRSHIFCIRYAAHLQNVNCYTFFENINSCITQLMIQYIYSSYLFPI